MSVAPTAKILIVDDDRVLRRLLQALLRRDFTLEEAASGEEALEVAETFVPNLVLLDIMMPGMDGYETCRRLKSSPTNSQTQVIMVSAKSSKTEQLQAYEAGADDYVIKPFDPQDLLARIRLHVQLQEANARVATIRTEIDSRNSEIRRLAEQRVEDVVAIQDVAVFTLAKLAESRDQETGGHLTRMRAYTQIIAEQLALGGPYAEQIDGQFLQDLYRSSPLHDIGKVAIRDEILLKPGKLSAEEMQIMQQHASIGAEILEQAVVRCHAGGFLSMAVHIARHHHERFDGTGYPMKLAGHAIPLPARIVAIADVYDALTSARPYKAAYSSDKAREMIERENGRHFDPHVVIAFQQRYAEIVALQQSADTEDAFVLSPLQPPRSRENPPPPWPRPTATFAYVELPATTTAASNPAPA